MFRLLIFFLSLAVLLTACAPAERLGEDDRPDAELLAEIGFTSAPELGREALRADVEERIDRAIRASEGGLASAEGIYRKAAEAWEDYGGEPEGDEGDTAVALEAATREGDLERVALYFDELGVFHATAGRLSDAVAMYHGALFLNRRLGLPLAWANARLNLNTTHFRLGRLRDTLRVAPELGRYFERQGVEYFDEAAIAWTNAGQVFRERHQYDEAERLMNRALELRRRVGEPLGMAATLFARGRLRLEAGASESAERDLLRAEAMYAREERTDTQVNTWLDLAELALVRTPPKPEVARQYLDRIEARVATGNLRNGAYVSQYAGYLRAVLLRDQGRIDEAISTIESVLASLEQFRSEASSELYVRFFERRLLFMDLLVGLEISRGRVDRALELTERARSRGFLEYLLFRSVSRDDEEGVPAELASRRDELRRGIESSSREPSDGSAAHLRTLLDALAELEAEIDRAQGGRPAPRRTLHETIQSLRSEEIVLAYWLGAERGWLWTVTPSGVSGHFELPGRRHVEASVRRVHRLITRGAPSRGLAERELAALAKLLLPDALPEDASIVILADGPLAKLPFALLPFEGSRLGQRHAVARAPSLSVLGELRRRARNRPPEPPQLLAVADPLYREDSWPRLPASAEEAAALADLFGRESSRLLLGASASRDELLKADLSRVTHLHFGAHAQLHPEIPELSAIYLSDRGKDGRLRDAAIRFRDVRDLEIRARVVTLAGCETALGETVRGEGTLALPRSFLFAGASSVVASLWAVEDAATAAMVRSFYEGLLRHGLTPAEALRQARRSVASQPRWSSPENWGGFVLLGDPTAAR